MKTAHHNTQNISNAQQQKSSLSIVELAPLNVGSSGKLDDARSDLDDGMRTTSTSQQSTSDQVERQNNHENEFYAEIQNNNGTNDIITIQAKLPLNQHEVTTEKLQLNAEKIVDNYPVVSEPHEANNAIGDNIFSDVDTNFIDIGQQVPRNNSSRFPFELSKC